VSARRVVRVDEAGCEAAAAAAAQALTSGELVVMPTDTVYGLAASLKHPEAIRRIFRAKSRPADMPLPVLVASLEDAERLVPGELEKHEALLSRFWPGALTVVVAASEHIPVEVSGGQSTVGLRRPDDAVAQAILRAAGGALAVTSANISGEPPAREVADLTDGLLQHVALVVDAGPCPGGVASAVIDLNTTPPGLLRAGPIGVDALRPLLPDLVE